MLRRSVIIDDDPVIVKIIETIFKNNHYPCTTFTDSLKAWEYCESNQIDLLIVDWNMPGLDGLTFSRRLRELRGEELLILMLTSHDALSDIDQALQNGVNDYLIKPISAEQMSIRLRILNQMMINVRERLNMHAALKKSQAHLKAIFDNSAVGVLVMNLEGELLESNETIRRILGYVELETIGKFILSCTHPNDREKLSLFFEYYMSEKLSSTHYEARYLTRSGLVVWGRLSISTVVSGLEQPGFVIIIIEDITEKRRYEEELSYNVLHDAMTGLPNRELFLDRLGSMLHRARLAKPVRRFAVIILDIDRFQMINESLGHAFGDILIRRVADRLSKALSNEDTLSRLTGDEFGILTESFKNIADLNHLVQEIQKKIREPFVVNSQEFNITASIGIKVYEGEEVNKSMILRDADTALHRTKKQGPNNYEFFTHEMNRESYELLQLENDLRKAVKAGELELYYQPQVNLSQNRIMGVEGLIRWNHPEKGLLLPSKFISIAENAGLIVDIGEFVLEKAISRLRAWSKQGYYPLKLSINFSAPQFNEDNLIQIVQKLQKKYHNPTKNQLNIELTESVLMQNQGEVVKTLEELKENGIQLAIDDFGTGYSSLAYLKTLPIDYIKIDASFIRNIKESEPDYSIVMAIIAMSHSLGMKAIAEGVETLDQVKLLSELSCDIIQGYFISVPLPEKELLEYFDQYLNKELSYDELDQQGAS